MNEVSAIELFLQAGIVVKSVMIILIFASIISWIIIFERYIFFRKANENRFIFEDKFWSGTDLNDLYSELDGLDVDLIGSTSVFKNSFKEFKRISNRGRLTDMDLERKQAMIFHQHLHLLLHDLIHNPSILCILKI